MIDPKTGVYSGPVKLWIHAESVPVDAAKDDPLDLDMQLEPRQLAVFDTVEQAEKFMEDLHLQHYRGFQ